MRKNRYTEKQNLRIGKQREAGGGQPTNAVRTGALQQCSMPRIDRIERAAAQKASEL